VNVHIFNFTAPLAVLFSNLGSVNVHMQHSKPPPSAVTLKDVGREAGVSYQTVSRVVNGIAGVKEGTRKRVLEAAQKLGFHPNRVAYSLRTNRSKTIGLIMADIENVFFAEVVGGVEAEASRQGYSVILANSSEDLEREVRAVFGLMERRVDGLIIAPADGDHSYLKTALPQHFPLVAINRAIRELDCGAVLTDNETGARTAVQYLIDRGHEKIGAITASDNLMTSLERLKGFKAAMKNAHLPVHEDWISTSGGFRPEIAQMAARKILKLADRPTAIFASGNRIAEGTLLALRELGLNRDRDVEVIGFDNVPWARLVDPPMPVIAQPAHEIGQRAVKMLLGLIHDDAAAFETVRLLAQLISHEIPRLEQPKKNVRTRKSDETLTTRTSHLAKAAASRKKSG
jgi:LacI family transcriptional regulator